MNCDFALIKLTIITVVRSYFFIFITLFTCAFTFLIPLTVFGSGSLTDLFQIRIEYSLNACSFLIFISSVWTGCSIMTADIESYKIHMLVVKPLSKFRIWLDRFFGIVIIHILFLILISFFIYLALGMIYCGNSLSLEEKTEISEKIFTVRKSYVSKLDGLTEELSRELNARIKDTNLSEVERIELEKKAAYTIISRRGEVQPGENKTFIFDIDKTQYSDNANCKFMLYIGSPDIIERQNRPRVNGMLVLQINNGSVININKEPQVFLSNNKYELKISLKDLSEGKNNVKLTYKNLDKNRSVFFRVTEFPQVQIKSTGFVDNYLRCFAIMSFGIILLSAIGCALGGMFSLPIAVFVIIAYLLFGSLGNFIISENEISFKNDDIQLKIGYSLSKTLLKVITPIQKFQLSKYLSAGMLIENNYIMDIIKKYFLIQFFVISVAGIYVFYRRELGVAVKK